MKRILTSLVFLLPVLWMGAAAQPAPLPDDARFDQPVQFQTGSDGESLSAMMAALARSADLTPIVDDVPDRSITYDIGDPKPFRQVWQLVLSLNDLDYELLENDVVVIGTPASLERVRGEASADETEADAAEAEATVEQRYYDVNNEPSQVVELLNRTVDGIEVQTLPGNEDTVVVDATADQHEQVQRVLDRFDTVDEGPETERRLYRVDTDPADVTEQLTEAFDDLDIQPLSEDRPNTLVVNATADQHERVETLIAEIEAAAAPDVEQRYYQVNRAPSEIVELVRRTVDEVEVEAVPGSDDTVVVDAIPDRHEQVQRVLDRFDTVEEEAEASERRFYRVNNDPGDVVQLLRQTIEDVDVEALAGDMQTIVVNATPDQHAQVESVLAEFDTQAERTPLEQRVYSLSNASAEELAGVLDSTDIVVEGDTTDGEGDGEGEDDGPREFTVVPDSRTNSLIITATPPVQERIAELIPELDAPQRQVNVQVRIQEINRRVAHNLGIDMSAGFGNLSANILEGGLNLIFDAQSVITSLNLGATLDALESQGLSRRVDDTNLTVLNNETGRMQSGGRIELTFPSSDGEISTRTIEFGVIVEVTPRVASDGRVIMDVTAEVSDVLVPLNEGGIPERIDFSEREVTSTVTLQQGQTVLLGGLLQNSFSQTQRRVPILGDIPVLGALFGSTEVEDENTELLLVVNAQMVD